MSRPTPRPFHLGDLMIVVAAVAGGFALHRWVNTPIDPATYRNQSNGYGWTYLPAMNWFDYLWIQTPSCYFLVVTMALVLMRWRGPRPSARRVLRQPGAVACLAVVGSFLYGFALHHVQKNLHVNAPNPHESRMLLGHLAAWNDAVRWVSPAVCGAWAALGWSGSWVAERSWLDRVGRIVGVYWLMYAPVRHFCWPFIEWLISIPQDSNWSP